MNIEKTLEELYGLSVFGIKLGLQNMEEILKRLDNPHNKYKVIHIAGTNGKGSTASMTESILLEAGYKVGKYTSPHINRFNERIVLNRTEITNEDIVFYYNLVKEKAKDIPATFFEITTAIMFLYFADKQIDYLVLEHPRRVILSPIWIGPPNSSICQGFTINGFSPREFNWGESLCWI